MITMQLRIYDCAFVVFLYSCVAALQFVAPQRHGIFTSTDPALSFPLRPSTVPDWLLVVLAFPCCTALIAFTVWGSKKVRLEDKKSAFGRATLGLLLGTGMSTLWTNVGKRLFGRPRPNFYALCKWDAALFQCTASAKKAQDAFMAFPSGHSSLSFAAFGFLSLYWFRSAGDRCRGPNSAYTHFVLLAPVYFAFWVASTRVHDYWHHCDDVLAGAIIGTLSALWGYRAVFDDAEDKPSPPRLSFTVDRDNGFDAQGEPSSSVLSVRSTDGLLTAAV